MRLARQLALLAVLTSAVLAFPAGASDRGPALGATTVVTSARSGYVDVLLPRDARLSPKHERNPDVSMTGSGRLLGLWLKPLDITKEDRLEVMRLPGFLGGVTQTSGSTEPAPVCTSDLTGYYCSNPKPKNVLLHAGRYRLTLLTDGKPVRVTLRLHGLTGIVGITPAHALTSAQMPLPALDTVGSDVVTYGATGPLGGNVQLFVAATAKGTGTDVTGESVCAREDASDPPPFAYTSACPGGTSGSYWYKVRGSTVCVFGGWVSVGGGSDAIGLGGSFTNDKGVKLGQTLGVWLRQP